jgi:hypothetical protein
MGACCGNAPKREDEIKSENIVELFKENPKALSNVIRTQAWFRGYIARERVKAIKIRYSAHNKNMLPHYDSAGKAQSESKVVQVNFNSLCFHKFTSYLKRTLKKD